MKKVLILLLALAMVLALPLYGLVALAEHPVLEVQTAVDGLAVPASVVIEPAERPPLDLTPLLQAAIGLAAAAIAAYVIPWLQQKKLMNYAHIAVYAAEKLIGPHMGEDKLEAAKAYLAKWGYNVDTDKVRAAIEAAVQQLTLEQAKQEEKPPNAGV